MELHAEMSGRVPQETKSQHGASRCAAMKKANTLVEYGAPIDPRTMLEPPDAGTFELEPGHPGMGDAAYLRRRQELFAVCRKHRRGCNGVDWSGYFG